MTHDPNVEASALDWVIRQRDPSFDAWEDFADWMAQDPAHSDIYYELAALDGDLGDLSVRAPVEVVALPADGAANDDVDETIVPLAPRRFSRRAWMGGAVAACLVGVISFNMLSRETDSYRIETAMGEMQEIKLPDGSRIAVNGGSSVVLSHDDPRKAVVERGQALFSVVHRVDAPFRVTVGDVQLVDVGTVFDVTRTDGQLVVAVSEGAVVYNPGAQNVRVDAGKRLAVRDGSEARLSTVNAEAVGGWRGGQLVYDGVPLGDVAAELARTTGIKVRTSPAAATILFRGALQTGTDEARVVGDLAALSGTRATQESGGWTLSR
ncbi:FecR family protein [Sphingobium nicotianae]|uniref:FecR domain-containing protein n=1 Tax=Sphingobium nicotianae TaxID=2782607 RepID=A0A9X1DDD5_9SPHN|nr:FecR domain-containing protein [Sphingobium nicotianae]MBT2187819.1 FecR domain-containing protein [Sphingobium nicotianae]